MKKLYVTLFSALFLGGAICASCTDKKEASAEERSEEHTSELQSR